MKLFYRYLHLDEVGFIELLVAFYPILGQYSWGVFHLNSLTLVLIDIIIILFRKVRIRLKNPLVVFTCFCLFKQFLCFFISKTNPTIGALFYDIVILVSIPIISSGINARKFIGSLSWVMIICVLGIIYHYSLFLFGKYEFINPLTLPFLEFDSTSRAFDEISRPTSFFWEPASYSIFMMIPTFYYLHERKYIISTILILSIFLSGSTNGIIFVFIILSSIIFFSKFRLSYKLITLFLLGLMYYALYNYKGFEVGVRKMENTDYENNLRLSNGPRLVKKMPIEHIIIGFPSPTVETYLTGNNEINQSDLQFQRTNTGHIILFVSDFWRILAVYGIIGLFLLMICYISIFRRNPPLRPYIVILLLSFFSQSLVLGMMWVFEWLFILSFVKLKNNNNTVIKKKGIIGIHRGL